MKLVSDQLVCNVKKNALNSYHHYMMTYAKLYYISKTKTNLEIMFNAYMKAKDIRNRTCTY